MVVITQQREKCIGCNYCVELAFDQWRMSKKDGKATLIGAENKKGFYTLRLDYEVFDSNKRAADACPVKIIKVKVI
ncbi:MAG: ferredoxin [Fluviicola sp.]|nr:ferredoxin [Fluviicola sp.]